MKAAARLGEAMRGREARPPRARLSRNTPEASSADACSGAVLRAARRKGRNSLSQTAPSQRTTSSTARPRLRLSNLANRKYSKADVPGGRRDEANTHKGTRPRPSDTVQRSPELRSQNAYRASFGPESR